MDVHAARDALRHSRLPAAFVDLGSFDENLRRAILYADGTPLRIATKSVRVPALLERALSHPEVIGLMCASPSEAAWWLQRRPNTDILIAYPSAEVPDLHDCAALLTRDSHVAFMVDCAAHLDLLARAGRAVGVRLDAVVDVDMSVDLGGARGVRFGVYRSPVRTPQDVTELAAHAHTLDGVRLVGIMGYEAQIAGLQDRPAGGGPTAAAIRLLKRTTGSVPGRRRAAAVAALRAAGAEVRLVNAGGSGSLPVAAGEAEVTEVAAGSALLCPTLFDGYEDVLYVPAAGFATRVTRRPSPRHVTCHGGGWIASGAPGADRLPTVVWPPGASLLDTEGAGEVQTPIILADDGPTIDVGDVVIWRHAKSGEVFDHVQAVTVLASGGTVERQPTYRGVGLCGF